MRVPNVTLFRIALSDLGSITEDNARLLEQTGTGRKLLRPSDSPGGAISQLRLKQEMAENATSQRSLSNGVDLLRDSELALTDASSVLQRAKELAVEGANSAHSTADFQAIAAEADQLINEMLAIGNRQIKGRYIFGGDATTTKPFAATGTPPTAVTYNGDTGVQTVSPSPGVDIGTNVPGSTAFASGGATDVFNALIAFRDAANNKDVQALSNSVSTNIDASLDHLGVLVSRIGSSSASLGRTLDTLATSSTNINASLSKVEDVDMVDAVIQLQNVQTRQQAALQAAGRVVQKTLFDVMA